MKLIKALLFLLPVFMVACSEKTSSPAVEEAPIDVTKLRFSASIYDSLRYEVIPKDSLADNALGQVSIVKALPIQWRKHRVAPGIIEKELLLKFTLVNTSDSVQHIYFYPGAYFDRFNLLRLSADGVTPVPVPGSETPATYRSAFRLLAVAPGERTSYIARLEFVRTSATMFYPAVLQKDYIESFINDKIQFRAKTNLITYVVAGIMLMMIAYSIAVYRQNRIREFIYYIGYAGCLALLLFLKSFLLYDFTQFNYFFESYWDFLLQCGGVGCYFLFIRKFLDTKTNHPFIDKTFRFGQYLMLAFLAIYTVLYFFTDNFIWLNGFENITKQILLVIGLIFIVYGAKRSKKDRLLRYLVLGNIWLLVFSLMSFLFIVTPLKFTNDPDFTWVNSAILYYEIGLVGELMYFLSGLAHKNRRDIIERTRESERLRIANEKKEMEKHMAILEAQQQERNRISADMHDELGSGVTAIRLMSEIMKTKMQEEHTSLPEIDKISNSANDLITKMNTIIWTMSSSNDTVENLITYIRTYALEFFDNTNIECRFNIPSTIPNIELTGEKRRNIFLAVKEALNNVVKHAKASEVVINVDVSDKLCISIQDNGVGVDFETIRRFGNGLKNMKSRLERINGKFTIVNNDGALTQFEMSL
ncbi:MAG TPA: sensor histidine kinase [Chitinophagaceae bacterium]|nr:sensor histidine kinase [Chitinophagaceae bacterium]